MKCKTCGSNDTHQYADVFMCFSCKTKTGTLSRETNKLQEVKNMKVEGIAIDGQQVEEMSNKNFEIIKSPTYEEYPDLDDPNKTKRRLKIIVKLSDGVEMDWFPNKTSIKTMTKKEGLEMDNWVGKKFEWKVLEQQVAGNLRKVIFIV